MQIFGKSDIGLVREQNQDSIYFGKNENDEYLAIVCDGIGGGNAGDIASSIGCSVMKQAFLRKPIYDADKSNYEWIMDTVKCANDAIFEEADKTELHKGMGTTLVGVFISKRRTYIFHLGDSRAYSFDGDSLSLLTCDHNLAQDLVKAGELTEKDANNHPQGNLLTNALGIWHNAKVEIQTISNEYNIILLCSDGLHGIVDENTILKILKSDLLLEEKVDQLITQSKILGGFDNVSVILIDKGDK